MCKKINNFPQQKFQNILLGIGIIFYVTFAVLDGPIIFNDSGSYIDISITREPIYSLFLALFRTLFGDGELYLRVVVVVQGIIAAVCSSALTAYISKEMKLLNVSSLGVWMFPYLVAILFRFVADDQFMYSNAILTEGIAFSLHLLFVRYAFEYLLYKSRKSIIGCAVLCFVGIGLRKQLIGWLIILVILVLVCKNKNSMGKRVRNALFLMISVILATQLFDQTCNFFINGQFARHANDNRFIATMIFYTAEEGDADKIENEELRELFVEIYDSCEKKELLKNTIDAGMGWYDRTNHFTFSYDAIQLKTMYAIIHEKLSDMQYARELEETSLRVDAVISYYIDALLVQKIPAIIGVYIDNLLMGFVTTVAQRNYMLSIFALLVYIGYFFTLIVAAILGSKEKNSYFVKKVLYFSILATLCVCVNNAIVALVIFCQSRYMIYNMSVFYISFFLLLCVCSKKYIPIEMEVHN